MGAYLDSVLGDRPAQVTYPHCDWRVLHSPGTCEYCDMHPDWQKERADNNVLFTDDPRNSEIIDNWLLTGQTTSERPCPAMKARGPACQIWAGNKAKPK